MTLKGTKGIFDEAGYRQWLEGQKYDLGTITAQMYRADRVEQHHGNLDEHYDKDRLASLINSLRHSNDDKRHDGGSPDNERLHRY